MSPYVVLSPTVDEPVVRGWAGYPLQFGGQRRFGWQDEFAGELAAAVSALDRLGEGVLYGVYRSTDAHSCDVENRLFTNPGAAIFGSRSALRFERGPSSVPPAPEPVASVDGHLYHYSYELASPDEPLRYWEAGPPVARWTRVARELAADGSGRPYWLAMKRGAALGQVEVLRPGLEGPFGIKLIVHGTRSGPRSAPATSEAAIDGVIASFHESSVTPGVAQQLASRLPGTDLAELTALLAAAEPAALFVGAGVRSNRRSVWLSPCDEHCVTGAVEIRARDATGAHPELSGEIFPVKPVA